MAALVAESGVVIVEGAAVLAADFDDGFGGVERLAGLVDVAVDGSDIVFADRFVCRFVEQCGVAEGGVGLVDKWGAASGLIRVATGRGCDGGTERGCRDGIG